MGQTRLHERWKTVSRNSLYEVSDQGRVRSFAKNKDGLILRPGKTKSGHLTVLLGRAIGSVYVHVLVAEAFLPERPDLPYVEVRHKDGNPENNVWANLAWSTRGRNTQDKKHHDGQKGRLKIESVREIKRRLAAGEKGRTLAKEFGVSEQAISMIRTGHNHPEVRI